METQAAGDLSGGEFPIPELGDDAQAGRVSQRLADVGVELEDG